MIHQGTQPRIGKDRQRPHGVREETRRNEANPIILIEDDRDWALAIESFLRDEGFAVAWANGGVEGLELLQHCNPSVVILDVHLPGMNGFHVLRELRSQQRNVPVIMVSGQDQSSLMAHALAEGASAFLRKPLPAEVLLRAIRRLLDPAK